MGRLVLVLGGARSGKSAFAERLARATGGDAVLYVATATITDDEMAARVARHRADRSDAWETVELPLRAGDALRERGDLPPVILLDCLTLLLSTPALTNPDLSEAAIEAHAAAEVDGLLRLRDGYPGALIVVSNEVGMGLHPNSALGRIYRDALGRANQRLAAHADSAYLLVAGIPLDLRRLKADLPDAMPTSQCFRRSVQSRRNVLLSDSDKKPPVDTLSTAEARDQFSDVINRAAYGKERVVLTRRGKALVAIVPIEDVEWLRELEDRIDLEDARRAMVEAEKKGTISFDDLKNELGL